MNMKNQKNKMTMSTEKNKERTSVLIVPQASHGKRLDVFLTEKYPEQSRSYFKYLIKKGCIQHGGQVLKASFRVKKGQVITIEWHERHGHLMEELEPEDKPIKVLLERRDYVVLYKPPGLVVHPGAGNARHTLVHRLLAYDPSIRHVGHPLRPGIVHRLDKGTAGVLIVARTTRGYHAFIRLFQQHRIRKWYGALVVGQPSPLMGKIESFLTRHPVDRKRFIVSYLRGKHAQTFYRTLWWDGRHAWVQIRIPTGRTHQIRVHFQHLGTPICGDEVYGRGYDEDTFFMRVLRKQKGLGLWAYRIDFRDPWTNELVTVKSPRPQWFRAYLKYYFKSVKA